MNTSRENVLLVQPPYLRLLGSHNDRIPLELCYLHSYIQKAGIKSRVFNADWTGATKYIEWKKLFSNSNFLDSAVDGQSPLFDETLERIASFEPTVVVLSAADNLTPWVDLGNAYSTALLSQRLMKAGFYTIGVGPFYSQVPHKFSGKFDAILVGTASPSIVDIIKTKPRSQIIQGKIMELDIAPIIDVYPSSDKDDVVMTAVGCAYHCSYCLAQKGTYLPISLDAVEKDIVARKSDLIDFGDAVLAIDMNRMNELSSKIKHLGKQYTCEISVNRVTPKILDALHNMGIVSLKMGVESGDEAQFSFWNKKQTIDNIYKSSGLIKQYGFRLTIYVLLGGTPNSLESAKKTLELCRNLQSDDYVINVLSFHDLDSRDFRYDAHFSQKLVKFWGLENIMQNFFELQPNYKPGLGQLI